MKYSHLFSPIKIGNVEIKNRFCVPPMMLGYADFSGRATDKLIDYYSQRAVGGFGLIITEITRVEDSTGATGFGQLSLSHDRNIKSVKKLTDSIHSAGAKIFVQLHHPGRQNIRLMMGTVPIVGFLTRICPPIGKLFWKAMPLFKLLQKKGFVKRVVAPSECPKAYHVESEVRALKLSEIKSLIKKFAKAARRAQFSGADGVELHMAHGYLLQQFLSPYTNQRTDEYGGSFENRMRFVTEIIRNIKVACGDEYPIIVRLSVDECYEDKRGYDLSVGIAAAKYLEGLGIAAIDVSIGGYDTFNRWLEPMSVQADCRKKYIAAVKNAVSVPVIAADVIRTAESAEKHIAEGIADIVSLGRQSIADPYFPAKIAGGKEDEIIRCINCLHCFESMEAGAYEGKGARCSINPRLGIEESPVLRDGQGKHIVVVGGGPSGLMAAFGLLERGFRVTIIEKNEQLGGQLLLAERPLYKERISWAIEDLIKRVRELGAEIITGTTASLGLVASYNPYAVIVATGSSPSLPAWLKTDKQSQLVFAETVLMDEYDKRIKKAIVIGSGMTGLEVAEYLADKGVTVTVLEAASELSPGQWFQHRDDSVPRLKANGVKLVTNARVTKVEKNRVYYNSGDKVFYENTDLIVVCVGNGSNRSLCFELIAAGIKTYAVGDVRRVGALDQATADGYLAATKLR